LIADPIDDVQAINTDVGSYHQIKGVRRTSTSPLKVLASSSLTEMDTSNSHEIIASETTPLVPAKSSKKPKTPLPKLQIGILITLQLAEPIASTSIFPYINQV
jgi:hypothetical protein